jgi:hypothetical protein
LILKSVVFGTLLYIVRRLGISLILFTYLYFAHTKRFMEMAGQTGGLKPEFVLAGIVVVCGTVIILFRSVFAHYCQSVDAKALPKVDQRLLVSFNRGDFSIMALRVKSRSVLDGAKALLLIFSLIVLCWFVARPLAFVLLAVLLFTVINSFLVGRMPEDKAKSVGLGRLRYQPDNFVEVLLVAGLIGGFLLITQDGGLISGTVLILMIARFSGAFKNVATSVVNLLKWNLKNKKHWEKQAAAALAKEERLAAAAERQAERRALADARRAERRALADARRAERQAALAARKAARAAAAAAFAGSNPAPNGPDIQTATPLAQPLTRSDAGR